MVPRHHYLPTPEQRRAVEEKQAELRAAVLISRARRPILPVPAGPAQVVIGSRVVR